MNASDDPWEDRVFGAQEQFVEVADDVSGEVDAVLGLHPISIRLQKSLIDNLKAIAHLHGLGYQPLIRQILTRWVDSEIRQMIASKAQASAEPVAASSKQKSAIRPKRAV